MVVGSLGQMIMLWWVREDVNISQDRMQREIPACLSRDVPMFPDGKAAVYTKLKTRSWMKTQKLG